jgi:hypothetical protein
MTDLELVKLSDSFAEYNDYIEGIDTIDGETWELISKVAGLSPFEYTDGDCIAIVENLIQNYHLWHKIDAGEGESE